MRHASFHTTPGNAIRINGFDAFHWRKHYNGKDYLNNVPTASQLPSATSRLPRVSEIRCQMYIVNITRTERPRAGRD
jgi:hypothetical protein